MWFPPSVLASTTPFRPRASARARQSADQKSLDASLTRTHALPPEFRYSSTRPRAGSFSFGATASSKSRITSSAFVEAMAASRLASRDGFISSHERETFEFTVTTPVFRSVWRYRGILLSQSDSPSTG
ncbi:Uncharacterised protein [Mycobacteroides abscessus subsp. abscessus]|nr:Uncharacterised protein [Mycobacteroides abscessus subsp. abscessus]